jgi:hypothetical protein
MKAWAALVATGLEEPKPAATAEVQGYGVD